MSNATVAALLITSVRSVVNKNIINNAQYTGQFCKFISNALAMAAARPVFSRATLKLANEPSKRITSSRMALCNSPVRKHPVATIATVPNNTEATSGIKLNAGNIITKTEIPIAINLRLTVGRSFSSCSKTTRSLLACKPLIASLGPCNNNTSPSFSVALPNLSFSTALPLRSANTVTL